MKRRDFIKASSLCAVAVSTSGFVFRKGKQFVGDCETTTDILGPYYRPNSPLRNNFLISGDAGEIVQLTGVIKHKDCITPYGQAKIELWHCNNKGEYDNHSEDYKYRGTAFSDSSGQYQFKTILPVPYDVGDGTMRPAHFHLMITAPGYQSLITQLYFTGDPFIKDDPPASEAAASRRILKIATLKSGTKRVRFDVSMSSHLKVSLPVLDKLTGTYMDQTDNTKKSEFFKRNDQLWKKTDVFGTLYEYVGDNTFRFTGVIYRTILSHFEIMPDKSIRLTETITSRNGDKRTSVSLKQA